MIFPCPSPAQEKIRIRHTAVALNFRDILVRRGQHSGKIVSVGARHRKRRRDRCGSARASPASGRATASPPVARPDCAYAEGRIAPAARTVKLPDGIDEKTAAAMMVRGMTARYLLKATYAVKPGDTIVIHAAAGGVGLIVSQWAKQLGATVIGTVGSDDKAAVAKAHGCDHVFRYDNFATQVREITGGKGVPVIYDSIGKVTFENSLKCLRPRGILASFGESSRRSAAGFGPPARQHGLAVRDPSEPDRPTRRRGRDLLETTNDLFAHGRKRQDQDRDQPQLPAA